MLSEPRALTFQKKNKTSSSVIFLKTGSDKLTVDLSFLMPQNIHNQPITYQNPLNQPILHRTNGKTN